MVGMFHLPFEIGSAAHREWNICAQWLAGRPTIQINKLFHLLFIAKNIVVNNCNLTMACRHNECVFIRLLFSHFEINESNSNHF